MDAKAKVVATLRLTEFVSYHWETSVPVYEMPLGPYIPLTDHEAALAEERELRISLESSWQQAEAQLFALIEKHAALLSGLDALAGEMFAKADECENAHYRQTGYEIDYENKGRANAYQDAAERLTTLASAGLEGKPE